MENPDQYDLAVIGGGINGCGIAADAALRGLSVVLIEKDDLASKTSSASSKLIHGGLRYLEQFDFSLVKKALDERQTLLTIAPHLVKPLPFVLPYAKNMRPTWILRAGLFLYDNLSRKNRLPKSRFLPRKKHPVYFSALNEPIEKGFLFYDARTDDARLTLNIAQLAHAHGAIIKPHTQLTASRIENGGWQLQTLSTITKQQETIHARCVINATGPWVNQINALLHIEQAEKMALVKGSHIVVKKLYEGNHAYLLQNNDQRIIFLIPYHNKTLIGTTDVPYTESLDEVKISPGEIDYLLDIANRYLREPLTADDIIDSWSGVRPLLGGEDKPQKLSRDYACAYQASPAPNLVVYGGKITTYRQLAKEAVDKLRPIFCDLGESSTQDAVLPGGDFEGMTSEEFKAQIQQNYRWLPQPLCQRLLNTYGALIKSVLHQSNNLKDMGQHFGQGLYQREVDYLIHHEWAQSAEDILWRRTRLGMYFSEIETAALRSYLKNINQSKFKC